MKAMTFIHVSDRALVIKNLFPLIYQTGLVIIFYRGSIR